MPHFDEYGGDEWICQVCCRVKNSRVESTWLPIPGKSFSGNVCPDCLPRVRQKAVVTQVVAQTEWDATHGAQYEQEEKAQTELYARKRTSVRRHVNALDYADDPAELEVQRELARAGVRNEQRPLGCPECGRVLARHGGMVGETILVCAVHGMVWEDSEDAIRRVF